MVSCWWYYEVYLAWRHWRPRCARHHQSPILSFGSVSNCFLSGRLQQTHHLFKLRPGRITVWNLKALQKIKVPQSKSGFPGNPTQKLFFFKLKHTCCTCWRASTNSASKDSQLRYSTSCVFGETECKLITQDVLWWSKITPLSDSFSLCSQSYQKHFNDAPSLGLGSDKPSVFLPLSSFSSHQTSSVRTEIGLPQGCWKEVILQRDLLPVWPRRTQTWCSVQVCEPFLSLALLFIKSWIKDWQDLVLHQSWISPAECKCYKQWRGIELLCCLYCRSFFLAAGAESSLRAFRTKLSG